MWRREYWEGKAECERWTGLQSGIASDRAHTEAERDNLPVSEIKGEKPKALSRCECVTSCMIDFFFCSSMWPTARHKWHTWLAYLTVLSGWIMTIAFAFKQSPLVFGNKQFQLFLRWDVLNIPIVQRCLWVYMQKESPSERVTLTPLSHTCSSFCAAVHSLHTFHTPVPAAALFLHTSHHFLPDFLQILWRIRTESFFSRSAIMPALFYLHPLNIGLEWHIHPV